MEVERALAVSASTLRNQHEWVPTGRFGPPPFIFVFDSPQSSLQRLRFLNDAKCVSVRMTIRSLLNKH
jgi:hypothetical protein